MKNSGIIRVLALLSITFSCNLYAQNYHLVWEDDFNGNKLDSSVWNIEERVGIWNTAQNAELQFYKTDNVSVGDDGNGNNCLILSALRESNNGYSFTSGRVNTNTKFSFKYGKLEARIKIPDLKNGLWPAFWTEGYTSLGWPDMGEIDILEMGHRAGINADTVNSYVASATHWEYNNSRADYGASVISPYNLSSDFHTVSMVWTPQYIKTYLDDTTLIYNFSLSGGDKEEYTDYFNFILINLAVGGILPDIANVDDVTAPFPAKMYIDYIKLYQLEGQENFSLGPHAIVGDFGVFSENNLTASMNIKFDAGIVSSGLDSSNIAPYEGFQVLSYTTKASTAFDLGVKSFTLRNMSGYKNGEISFMIKTDFSQSMTLKFTDKNGASASVNLDASKFYNPDRDNTWRQVVVPISEFTGTVDFANLVTLFEINGAAASASKSISVDNIIWKEAYTGGPITDQYYGVFAEHPSITRNMDFATTGHLYVWNGFTATTVAPVYGKAVFSFSANTGTWNGIGLQSDDPINLSAFSSGYMNFFIKTNSSAEFSFGFKNQSDQAWEIKYTAGSSTSAFKRDGKWHLLSLPLKSFPAISGVSLSPKAMENITIPFYLVGTINFAMDEVYFSRDKTRADYGIFITDVKNKEIQSIRIYPVPAKDILFIDGIESRAKIEIYSIDGRLEDQLISNSDLQIDISGYKSGLYFVNISTPTGNLKKKFIVE